MRTSLGTLPYLLIRQREGRATGRERRRGSACRCFGLGDGAPLESGCEPRHGRRRTSATFACAGTARSRRRNGRCEFSARLFDIASIAVVAAAKPLAIGEHRLDTLAFDFGREHRAGPVPPVRQALAPALHYGDPCQQHALRRVQQYALGDAKANANAVNVPPDLAAALAAHSEAAKRFAQAVPTYSRNVLR